MFHNISFESGIDSSKAIKFFIGAILIGMVVFFFSLPAFAQNSFYISAQVDDNILNPGETVTLEGNVQQDNNPVENQLVRLYLDGNRQDIAWSQGSSQDWSSGIFENMDNRNDGKEILLEEKKRLSVIFVDKNTGKISWVNQDGVIENIDVSAIQVGGVGDINNDGGLEIAFVDPDRNVKYTDIEGNVSSTGVNLDDPGYISQEVADFNGDGYLEIPYTYYNNDTVGFVSGDPDNTDKIFNINNHISDWPGYPKSISGIGDILGNGLKEVAVSAYDGYIICFDYNGNITVLDDDPTVNGDTIQHLGGVGDLSGDGVERLFAYERKYPQGSIWEYYTSGSYEKVRDDAIGGYTDPGKLGSLGDFTGNGSNEIAFIGSDEESVEVTDSDGNVTSTPADASWVSDVVDVDDSSGYATSGVYISQVHDWRTEFAKVENLHIVLGGTYYPNVPDVSMSAEIQVTDDQYFYNYVEENLGELSSDSMDFTVNIPDNIPKGRYARVKFYFRTQNRDRSLILDNFTLNANIYTDNVGDYLYEFDAPQEVGAYQIKAEAENGGTVYDAVDRLDVRDLWFQERGLLDSSGNTTSVLNPGDQFRSVVEIREFNGDNYYKVSSGNFELPIDDNLLFTVQDNVNEIVSELNKENASDLLEQKYVANGYSDFSPKADITLVKKDGRWNLQDSLRDDRDHNLVINGNGDLEVYAAARKQLEYWENSLWRTKEYLTAPSDLEENIKIRATAMGQSPENIYGAGPLEYQYSVRDANIDLGYDDKISGSNRNYYVNPSDNFIVEGTAELLRGDGTKPMEGADVTLTLPSNQVTVQTDENGDFSYEFVSPATLGEYGVDAEVVSSGGISASQTEPFWVKELSVFTELLNSSGYSQESFVPGEEIIVSGDVTLMPDGVSEDGSYDIYIGPDNTDFEEDKYKLVNNEYFSDGTYEKSIQAPDYPGEFRVQVKAESYDGIRGEGFDNFVSESIVITTNLDLHDLSPGQQNRIYGKATFQPRDEPVTFEDVTVELWEGGPQKSLVTDDLGYYSTTFYVPENWGYYTATAHIESEGLVGESSIDYTVREIKNVLEFDDNIDNFAEDTNVDTVDDSVLNPGQSYKLQGNAKMMPEGYPVTDNRVRIYEPINDTPIDVYTDENGDYERWLEAPTSLGKYEVSTELLDLTYPSENIENIHVKASDMTTNVDKDYYEAYEDMTISGTVEVDNSSDKNPVKDQPVYLYLNGSYWKETTTNSSGYFEIQPTAPGSYGQYTVEAKCMSEEGIMGKASDNFSVEKIQISLNIQNDPANPNEPNKISGTAEYQLAGDPVENTVHIEYPFPIPSENVTTDSTGYFEDTFTNPDRTGPQEIRINITDGPFEQDNIQYLYLKELDVPVNYYYDYSNGDVASAPIFEKGETFEIGGTITIQPDDNYPSTAYVTTDNKWGLPYDTNVNEGDNGQYSIGIGDTPTQLGDYDYVVRAEEGNEGITGLSKEEISVRELKYEWPENRLLDGHGGYDENLNLGENYRLYVEIYEDNGSQQYPVTGTNGDNPFHLTVDYDSDGTDEVFELEHAGGAKWRTNRSLDAMGALGEHSFDADLSGGSNHQISGLATLQYSYNVQKVELRQTIDPIVDNNDEQVVTVEPILRPEDKPISNQSIDIKLEENMQNLGEDIFEDSFSTQNDGTYEYSFSVSGYDLGFDNYYVSLKGVTPTGIEMENFKMFKVKTLDVTQNLNTITVVGEDNLDVWGTVTRFPENELVSSGQVKVYGSAVKDNVITSTEPDGDYLLNFEISDYVKREVGIGDVKVKAWDSNNVLGWNQMTIYSGDPAFLENHLKNAAGDPLDVTMIFESISQDYDNFVMNTNEDGWYEGVLMENIYDVYVEFQRTTMKLNNVNRYREMETGGENFGNPVRLDDPPEGYLPVSDEEVHRVIGVGTQDLSSDNYDNFSITFDVDKELREGDIDNFHALRVYRAPYSFEDQDREDSWELVETRNNRQEKIITTTEEITNVPSDVFVVSEPQPEPGGGGSTYDPPAPPLTQEDDIATQENLMAIENRLNELEDITMGLEDLGNVGDVELGPSDDTYKIEFIVTQGDISTETVSIANNRDDKMVVNPDVRGSIKDFISLGGEYLFSIDNYDMATRLQAGDIPDGLAREFEEENLPISQNLTLESANGGEWELRDESSGNTYLVREENYSLEIYGEADWSIEPDDKEEISFSANVPENQEPGRYFGEIKMIEKTDEKIFTLNEDVDSIKKKLNEGKISENLEEHLGELEFSVSEDAQVSVQKENEEWKLTDKTKGYDFDIQVDEGSLVFYARKLPIGTLKTELQVLKKKVSEINLEMEKLSDRVEPGDNAVIQVDVVNDTGIPNIEAEVTMQVLTINPELVTQISKTVEISGSMGTELVSIPIPENLKEGDYRINASARYSNGDKVVEAEEKYSRITVKYDPVPFLQKQVGMFPVWALVAVAVTGTIGGVASYLYYRRRKRLLEEQKRYEQPLDPSSLPSDSPSAAWFGRVAETDDPAYIDLNDLNTHAMVAGATGSGKTIMAQDIIEEALEKGVNVYVFDPTSQWSGFLDELEDEEMLSFFDKFDMDKDETRSYSGRIKVVKDSQEYINIGSMIQDEDEESDEGKIYIYDVSNLKSEDMDVYVAQTIKNIFDNNPQERNEVKDMVVFDEAHRLLPRFGGEGLGMTMLERGVREFRKWGIAIMLVSQVISDFEMEARANIRTQVQLWTRDERELDRVKEKFGEEHMKSISKANVGTGMVFNSDYNKGRPYYITFRPIKHHLSKLDDEEIAQYDEYGRKLEDVKKKMDKLDEEDVDIFDIEVEYNLAEQKLEEGAFDVVDLYLDSIKDTVDEKMEEHGLSVEEKGEVTMEELREAEDKAEEELEELEEEEEDEEEEEEEEEEEKTMEEIYEEEEGKDPYRDDGRYTDEFKEWRRQKTMNEMDVDEDEEE